MVVLTVGPKLFFSFYLILLLETREIFKEFIFLSDNIACLKTQLVQNCITS